MALTKIKYHMIDEEALDLLAGAGAGAAETTADVLAQQNIGYIPAGDTVPTGTSLQEFLELLLTTTFYPAGHEPTASLDRGGVTLSQEAGSNIANLVITGGYTAGYVSGKQNTTSGLWEPNTHQSDAWTGAVTKYTFSGTNLASTDNGTTAALTVGAVQIPTSGLSYTVAVAYAAGAYVMQNSKGQTKDANNADYVVHPSGTVSANLNFTSYRNSFYGVDSATTTVPTDNTSASTIVRALSGTHANPAQGNTIVLNPAVGTTRVMFAYPDTLRDVTSVIDSGTGYDIKASFTKLEYTVAGANGYSPIGYKIYHFVPPAAFSAATTYTVTI